MDSDRPAGEMIKKLLLHSDLHMPTTTRATINKKGTIAIATISSLDRYGYGLKGHLSYNFQINF